MSAVVRPHRLIGSGLTANQIASCPVLADGFLGPAFPGVVLLREIVDVEVDRPRSAVGIGHVERIGTRAQSDWDVLDTWCARGLVGIDRRRRRERYLECD